MKTLTQIGEFALIQKISQWCDPGKDALPPPQIQVPLGDDAFVVKMASNSVWAFTTDTLMEGTHFRFDWLDRCGSRNISWHSLGFKAMASNLSDLAAMGGFLPRFAFVTLGLNGDISVNSVENCYRGMRELTQKYRFSIVGGDLIRSDKSFISITMAGCSSGAGKPITRTGAKPGDAVMVTGSLGLSAGGLEVLKRKLFTGSHKNILINSHTYPQPQLEMGVTLSQSEFHVSSLLDTSDDLLTSLEILSHQSQVGFHLDLDLIPIHPVLAAFCRKIHESPYRFFLCGGEDYQLLFTCPENQVDSIRKKISSAFRIGKVKEKSFGIQMTKSGKPFQIPDARFRHF